MGDKSVVILLVEDEEAHAKLIKKAIVESMPEWELHHVSNLEDAFRWINENDPPSVIVADHRLPDGDGLELIEGAKRVNGTKIPVIVLTAYGTEEIAVHSLKSGAMDYVVKSAERFKELPWIVERTLREWGCILAQKEANEYIS